MSKVRLSGNPWTPTPATDTLPGCCHGDNQGRARGNSPHDSSWHIDTLALLSACGRGRRAEFSVPLCLEQQQEHGKSMCVSWKKVWSFYAKRQRADSGIVWYRSKRRGWKDPTENKAPVCYRLHVWPWASHSEPQFQHLLKGQVRPGRLFFLKDVSF